MKFTLRPAHLISKALEGAGYVLRMIYYLHVIWSYARDIKKEKYKIRIKYTAYLFGL